MPDIIIKGMEMPESCEKCNIKAWEDADGDYVCPFSGVPVLSIGRQDGCPLRPAPDGGNGDD